MKARRAPIFGSPRPLQGMGIAERAKYVGLFNRVAATLEQDRRLEARGTALPRRRSEHPGLRNRIGTHLPRYQQEVVV